MRGPSDGGPAGAEPPARAAPPAPRLVSFRAGDLTLRGYLHVPPGSGPFPAVIWNHGSERHPGTRSELGRFYTAAGYVLFVPHRRGHGCSDGTYALDSLPARARAEAGRRRSAYQRRVVELVIEHHERHLDDTAAAVRWLEREPLVDERRIAMSGVSYGGTQTLLAAEADVGACAYVPFAPSAMSWAESPQLQGRLVRAVRGAKAPMFLLQAANDYDLGPSRVLGEELSRRGGPSRARVYAPYGDTHASGHGTFACEGTAVWGDDVCEFLDEVLGPASAG
jgi:carboxymethylenebutenolidase